MTERRAWSEDETGLLHRLSRTHSAAEIGAQLGRSAKSVKEKARHAGIRLRKTGERYHAVRHSTTLVVEVMQLARQGLTCREISNQTGVSPAQVNSIRNAEARITEVTEWINENTP